MDEVWERQRRELDSYNTFFAAIKGDVTGEGLDELGYRLVGRFLRIFDARNDAEASPDFVLFNGETLLLVEIKSGENINQRHIDQMEEFTDISIEAAQEYLDETPIESTGLDPSGLRSIQPCIVYYKEFIEDCKSYESCRESLEELKDVTAVLTQGIGEALELEGGTIVDEAFGERLNDGIALPQAVDKNVYLTEGMEKESLAFSICYDIVVNNLGTGRIVLEPADVMEHYLNREVPLGRVSDVFRFLDEMGCCRETEEAKYEFTRGHLRNIVGIEEQLAEQSVADWLGDSENGQQTFDDYLGDSEE